jgi:branched-chain amino acid transport system substrate-binding protein
VVAVAIGAAVVAANGEATPDAAGAHALDPATGSVVDSVDLGTAPSSVAVGEGGAWVLDADDRTISQIDAETRELKRTFSTSSTPTDVAAGAGALWVGNGGIGPEADNLFPKSVSRFDPTTLQPIDEIDLPRLPSGVGYGVFPGATTQRLAVSADSVWVVSGDLTVYRIDPRSNRIVAHVDDVKAQNVAVGDGDVWVTEDGKLVEIDTGTNEVARRVSVGDDLLSGIAVGGGAVWATAPLSGIVYRVDTRGANPVAKEIPLDTWVNGVAFGQGAAWATNEIMDTVYRLDPRTGSPRRVEVDSPRGVAAGAEGVWITTSEPPSRDTSLPSSVCGDVYFDGESRPDVLLVSDLTLKGQARDFTQPMVDAIRLVLEQRGFEAGAFSVGYQSCDNSTAQSGAADFFRCASNAKAYARNLRVVGVFGSFNSPCSYSQIPITNDASEGPLAMVSPSATLADLTTDAGLYPTGKRSFFRLAAAEDYLPDAQVQLAKQLGRERLFVLESKGKEYGEAYLGELRASARRHGVTIVGTESFDTDSTSQGALARRVAASRPESVAIVGDLTPGTGALLRELRASLGPRVSISATDAFAEADALRELAGPAAGGLYVVWNGMANDLLPPKGKQFLQTFAAANGGDPGHDFSASYGAQGAEIFLDAIARSDGTRASITQELHRTAVRDGILGDVRWDARGDLLEGPITALHMEGGELKPDRLLLVRPPRRSAP